MISGNLWNYYRDEIDDVDDNASDGKSFKYKTKIVRKTPERSPWPPPAPQNLDGTQPPRPLQPAVPTLNVEVTIPLEYLRNFWRFLHLPLINCETELDLSWRKDYLLIEHHNNITGATIQLNNATLYVPVVTLSISNNIKLLENIKQEFKRTILWNKYRSEVTTQPKNNNLDYLINPAFRNINWLLALSFKNGNVVPTRNLFDKYNLPLVEIKEFNALIDNKPFFDQPAKTNKKRMKNLSKCQEMMAQKQELYSIIFIIKNIVKLLV